MNSNAALKIPKASKGEAAPEEETEESVREPERKIQREIQRTKREAAKAADPKETVKPAEGSVRKRPQGGLQERTNMRV